MPDASQDFIVSIALVGKLSYEITKLCKGPCTSPREWASPSFSVPTTVLQSPSRGIHVKYSHFVRAYYKRWEGQAVTHRKKGFKVRVDCGLSLSEDGLPRTGLPPITPCLKTARHFIWNTGLLPRRKLSITLHTKQGISQTHTGTIFLSNAITVTITFDWWVTQLLLFHYAIELCVM